MAEGFLKSFDPTLDVVSAGTDPSRQVHPKAIQVMKEENVDISNGYPKNVSGFLDKAFDYVITVCGGANENCPVFAGEVEHRLHIGFDDPAEVTGTEEFVFSEFRRIRDEIKRDFREFYDEKISVK